MMSGAAAGDGGNGYGDGRKLKTTAWRPLAAAVSRALAGIGANHGSEATPPGLTDSAEPLDNLRTWDV